MIKQLFAACRYALLHPQQAAQAVLARSRETDWKGHVHNVHGFSSGLPTVDILDLCPDFAGEIRRLAFLEGGSLPMDYALLANLARLAAPCDYLEIGSWRGESLVNVRPFCNRCVSINLSTEEILSLGGSQAFADQIYGLLPEDMSIESIRTNSRKVDFSRLANQFDLVFIDGDHSKEGVEWDTRHCFDLLKDDNSVIVWHDYGRTPETVRHSTLAGILDGCPASERKHLYHVSNTLCAVYTRRTLPTRTAVFPATPDKHFRLTIEPVKH